MKKKISILLFVVMLAGALSACATTSDKNGDYQRTLNVAGNGKVYLIPDIAYINLGTRSQAEKVSDALSANNAQAQAIKDALINFGVDEKDIQTTAFNVYPQQDYSPEGEVTRTTYVVENTVFIKIRDLSRMGEMLDATVRAGANSINGISFDVENRTQAEADARRMAVEDARTKAEEMATAAGVTLGDVLSVNVYSSASPASIYEGKGGGVAVNSVQVPVAAGQLVISADANITYEIK